MEQTDTQTNGQHTFFFYISFFNTYIKLIIKKKISKVIFEVQSYKNIRFSWTFLFNFGYFNYFML